MVDGGLTVTSDIYIGGNMSVTGSKNFLIDHPLDPKNKILRHAAIESPDVKNMYDGIAVLDNKGEARIQLPDYFEALNKDYRYQLTPIGKPTVLYVKEEVQNNMFMIAGGDPGQKVSWQVTGIRNDAYARKHPMKVEEEKGQGNNYKKGKYLAPDCF